MKKKRRRKSNRGRDKNHRLLGDAFKGTISAEAYILPYAKKLSAENEFSVGMQSSTDANILNIVIKILKKAVMAVML